MSMLLGLIPLLYAQFPCETGRPTSRVEFNGLKQILANVNSLYAVARPSRSGCLSVTLLHAPCECDILLISHHITSHAEDADAGLSGLCNREVSGVYPRRWWTPFPLSSPCSVPASPSSPFLPLRPLEVGPQNRSRVLGSAKLPQWGLGQSPSRQRI